MNKIHNLQEVKALLCQVKKRKLHTARGLSTWVHCKSQFCWRKTPWRNWKSKRRKRCLARGGEIARTNVRAGSLSRFCEIIRHLSWLSHINQSLEESMNLYPSQLQELYEAITRTWLMRTAKQEPIRCTLMGRIFFLMFPPNREQRVLILMRVAILQDRGNKIREDTDMNQFKHFSQTLASRQMSRIERDRDMMKQLIQQVDPETTKDLRASRTKIWKKMIGSTTMRCYPEVKVNMNGKGTIREVDQWCIREVESKSPPVNTWVIAS